MTSFVTLRRGGSLRLGLAGLLALACAVSAPMTASASPDTLKRAVGNLVQAPLDLVFSPYVAVKSVTTNIKEVDDTPGVRAAYFLPGILWVTGVEMGASAIRAVTGALELVPGIILLPMEADLDPLYDPVDRGDALVEFETPIMDVKFGIDYQRPAY